ncbi:MAG: DMT family transporter [Pseudomonadota bacterium]
MSASPSVWRAIAVSVSGIFLLEIMAALVKVLIVDYPAPQLAVYRNVFAMLPAIILLSLTPGWRWRLDQIVIPLWQLGLLRGCFIAVAQVSFYFSLSFMPFATASALTFTMSLFTTAFSAPLLGHKVGIWRWSAVLTGFLGIMLILRPGSDTFTVWAVLPVLAAVCYAATAVTSPLFPKSVPTAAINLWTGVSALIGATILTTATSGWVPIASATDLGLMVAMGLVGGCGVLLLIFAYRMTEPSNLSPFDYFGILFAFTIGYFFFGESPVDELFPGVIFIIAGGILIVWRERLNKAREKAA